LYFRQASRWPELTRNAGNNAQRNARVGLGLCVGMQIEVSQELMALHGDEIAAMMAPPSLPGLR
jgi:hypothetical protein